jgi:uncharacterized protein YjbI with pentapeptide repeats
VKSDEPQLQLPQYSPDGYTIKAANDQHVVLVPGGDYKNLIFSEVNFSQITIKADFSGVTFQKCVFDKTDLSGSTLSSAHFDDCLISDSALMWCQLSNAKFTETLVENTRFAFSDLSQSSFASSTTLCECNLLHVNLTAANLNNAAFVDCGFLNVIAPDVTIRDCHLERVHIKESIFFGLHVKDSAVDFLIIMDSNMSGSSWTNVTSDVGHWIVWGTDFTAAYFSLCDVKDAAWNKTKFFGVVMERCNWFQNRLTKCEFEESTMNSVGWNETKFNEVHFINLKASALRLRFADFYCCFLKNCVIKDSAFEYCQLWASSSDNFEIVRPTYSQETKWHAGFIPDTQPHSTDHPKNN